ncbi:primosomal protein N' [Marinagarivorans algicola]|uniref:primosomal protein N' n=1 Tax=Marinagarivorans algicola TaxID=1513270 RepID=UPI0037351E64
MPEPPLVLTLALPTPLYRHFEYLAPLKLDIDERKALRPGMRLEVPFGKQTLVGVLLSISHKSTYPLHKLKPAHKVLDTTPIITGDVLALCQFAAEYYQHPLGDVMMSALPQKLRTSDGTLPQTTYWQLTTEGKGLSANSLKRSPKQQSAWQALLTHSPISEPALSALNIDKPTLRQLHKKGLAESFQQTHSTCTSTPATHTILKEPHRILNTEQQAAFDALTFNSFQCSLLEGITGSGKTEVYLHAIERVLHAGQQALVLVPEIGLTPQTVARFAARFGVPITQLHSSVAKGARLENWHAAQTGQARIIIGTRLAVFAPAPRLGIIIVDEEHDSSFKQQEGLRYNARDLAILRAKHNNIPVLMGSATPSLESLHNALSGRYQHLRITERAGSASTPTMQRIDMRKQTLHCGIAQASLDAIGATLARDEQVLVFINRRGFAPSYICQSCGWSAACKFCDARMTLHSKPRKLHCHHCGNQSQTPSQCPSCYNPTLTALGQGTERAEDVLQTSFKSYKVIRVDQDSMQRKNAMAALTTQLNEGKPCLLVGTQMLAKGHHFPNVTLVVIVDTDQGLMSGDFRGIERMGQLIVQVAGRAGREEKPGTVLIQSYRPEHPMLEKLVTENYHNFAQSLLLERQQSLMPPFSFMALLRAEAKHPDSARGLLTQAAQLACEIMPPSDNCRYLGPIPAFMERRNDRFRFQLQLQFSNRQVRAQLLKALILKIDKLPLSKRVRWSIDVDPQDMG